MILDKKFYERETVIVAKQLIGKILTRKIQGKKLTGIITETEAYRGKDDLASHAATNLQIEIESCLAQSECLTFILHMECTSCLMLLQKVKNKMQVQF